MADFATETAEERVARLSAELADEKKPNPFSYMVETSYRVNLEDDHDPFEDREPAVVRFALVSMPHFEKGSFTWTPFSSLQGGKAVPAGVNSKFCDRQLAASNPDKSAQMLRAFREALEAAVEKFQPHIV